MFLKTFHVVGHNHAIEHMMVYQGFTRVALELARVVIFTGGVDVHPRLYKAPKHPETHSNNARDMTDIIAWTKVGKKPDVLKVGICRGAQFLCVMNGGELWQDVNNHGGNPHPIKYFEETGKVIETVVNSTHHQMMRPGPNQFAPQYCERWAWCYLSTYRDQSLQVRRKSNYLTEGPDHEILFYRNNNCLCFQPHPEYSHTETRKLFEVCLNRAMVRASMTLPSQGNC